MELSETDRAVLVYRARLAEQAERWVDMAKAISEVAQASTQLTFQETLLMVTAFKNVVAPLRVQWKLAVQAQRKYGSRGIEARAAAVANVARETAEEIKPLCRQVHSLLQRLQPADAETAALFAKTAADYARYEAEVAGGSATEAVGAAYQRAVTACAELPATSAVKLGTALNLAVFTHDLKQQPAQAIAIAQEAVDGLGGIEPTDRHAHLACALLKSNVAIWQSETTA